MFLGWPCDRVVLAVELERALPHPVDVPVRRTEPADVDRPHVEWRFPADDPLGEHLACAAAGCNAERIEARADKEARDARSRPQDEIAVGRETLGPVDELLDAGGLERRHA